MVSTSLVTPDSATQNDAALFIEAGCCHVFFAYDIGFAIDLDSAEQHIRHTKHRESIRRTRKAPRYFQYHPPPLGVNIAGDRLPIAGFSTDSTIELIVYDFGAVSVIYRIPFSGGFDALKQLGLALYDNESLLHDSGRRVQQLMDAIQPTVTQPSLRELVEDYVVFQVSRSSAIMRPQRIVPDFALPVAQLLRAESEELSVQEIDDSLAHRISFGQNDLTIIDWNAAFVLGGDMDDVLAVLEFANVELLEMRFLDDQLDRALTEAHARFAKRTGLGAWKPGSRSSVLQSVARLQLDSAFLFESVNNTLKLLGDPYLARVYRLASRRFHLAEWDASILRKLGVLESIYSKISDQQSAWRMEVLEWIIIVLIAISIVLSFK